MFNKKTFVGLLAVLMVLGMASMAMAEDGSAKAAGLWIFFGIAIACGFGIGVAALGTGIGMGNAINGALQGTARNPEAGGKIMTTMIIGLALIESLCIYALVICFIMVFKIPGFETIVQTVFK
jgi:F-type H+-transporting ATPase subunit c